MFFDKERAQSIRLGDLLMKAVTQGMREPDNRPWYYTLDAERNVCPIEGIGEQALFRWAMQLEDDAFRTVGCDEVGDCEVSTIFLGLDHAYAGEPLVFETMIFGAPEPFCQRYHTWAEAEEGHKNVVAALQIAYIARLQERREESDGSSN